MYNMILFRYRAPVSKWQQFLYLPFCGSLWTKLLGENADWLSQPSIKPNQQVFTRVESHGIHMNQVVCTMPFIKSRRMFFRLKFPSIRVFIGQNSLGGQSRERGGNLAPYEDLWGQITNRRVWAFIFQRRSRIQCSFYTFHAMGPLKIMISKKRK